MSRLDGWRHRLAVLVGRDRYAREIDDEIEHHLERTAIHTRGAESVGPARLNSTLVGVFSLFALVLASIGIYGVISYTVVQRTREIGIRIALGAPTSTVVRLIMRQGMTPVVLGVVAGLAGSIAMTRLISGLLFGVGATDPLTFVTATAVLATVGAVACLVPAVRAARVVPTGRCGPTERRAALRTTASCSRRPCPSFMHAPRHH